MQKTKLLPGLAIGALALGVAGLSNPAAAAGHSWHSASAHSAMRLADDGDDGDDGDDDDDDDGEDTASAPQGGGSGAGSSSGSGSGQLPSTGTDPSSMLMLGGFALTAGGAMYRVVSRRTHPA